MKRIGVAIFTILFVCLGFWGCGGGSSHKNSQTSNSTKTLTSITVTSTGATSVAAGTALQLAAHGNYSDGTVADITSQVAWSTSNGTLATASSTGMLTTLQQGAVTVSAIKGSITGTLIVQINQAAVSSIAVTGGAPTTAGSSEQLNAVGTYTDGKVLSITNLVTWQSSDPTVATISASGMLQALHGGTVTATATMGTVSGTATIAISGPSLSSITITPAVFTIGSGQSKQLTVEGVYTDGTSQDVSSQVTWASGNTGAATVSTSGLVTGVGAGNSTITATFGAQKATALATVLAATLNQIVVTPASPSIATGQTQNFMASGLFSDGSSTDLTNSVTWTSSATNFATVDQTGLATGKSAGSATITATAGTVSGSATLTVTTAVLTEIDISPDAQTIPVGGQLQLSLTGVFSDSTTQTLGNATWSTSDSTLALVDPNTGIVTGVANSNNNPVTITANYGGFADTTTVYVSDAVAESIQLTPATASIASGTTQQYSVNVVYSDGSLQPVTAGLSWSSSSASVAGIDTNGLATGLAAGQTKITVKFDSMTASADLTVTQAVLTNLVVTPISTVVGINGNVQYTATGVFSDSSTQDLTSQVLWTSSNGNFATISAAGLATGVSSGTVQITATSGTISGSATLNVTTAKLVSIAITPSNPIVPPHSKIQLTAVGTFSDNSTLVLSGVSWHTNSAKYAMVNGSGVLRTKKSANQPVNVYASLNGITGSTSVTITSMTIQTWAIQPSNSTIAAGTQEQLSLIGTFSDGVTQVDLTASARWQTSSYQDAVVNRQGVVTGVNAGSTTITASLRGQGTATTNLTVSNATISSITVTPANPTIALGGLQQFNASGLFSDGSTQDITTVCTWTSSTPTVAVVNQRGVASSATHGQTNINATFNGVTGSTPLNVN